MSKRLRIGVIGHVEHITLGRVAAIPRTGEIAHLHDTVCFGGGGGGVAFHQLAASDAELHLFTALGDDDAGASVEQQLAGTSATIHVARRPARHTRDVAMIDPSGERTIVVVGEPLHPLASDPLPWELLGSLDAVYFTAQDPQLLARARAARLLVATARRQRAIAARMRSGRRRGSRRSPRRRRALEPQSADRPAPLAGVVVVRRARAPRLDVRPETRFDRPIGRAVSRASARRARRTMTHRELVSYQACLERVHATWSHFQERRRERLVQRRRLDHGAAEKVAENILEDLFTMVLDWPLEAVNYQEKRADIVLTTLGIKRLVVEVKRPGHLVRTRRQILAALEQAVGYAAEQKVTRVAISDGIMLYAADVEHGGLRDRVFADLNAAEPDESLWWLSTDGVYRRRTDVEGAAILLPDEVPERQPTLERVEPAALHPKYHLPFHCFAYVGDAGDPHTWALPYLHADGTIDTSRLPKAIGAVLRNYRGRRVRSVPEVAIPDVLERLGHAAARLGKLPQQDARTSRTYQDLAQILDQIGRLEAVLGDAAAAEKL